MIIRILLALMIIWLFIQVFAWGLKWFLVRKLKHFTQNPFSDHLNQHFGQAFKPSNHQSSVNENQPLVQCAHCGIYITKGQALEKADQYYCCVQHIPSGS